MGLPVTTYVDNKPRYAPVTTVGFKISKPGYDANRTAGSNFVFDSSWPSLPIAYEVTIDNTITSPLSTAIIPHNLGYAGFAMIWAYGPDDSGIGNVGKRFIPFVDTTNVYLNGNSASTPPFTATKLKIRVFQLDLSQDIDYELAPGDTFNMPYDNNFGVKVAKPFKDVSSKDMRDFSLHSRCQSPLILAVKNQTTTSPSNPDVIQYTTVFRDPIWVYGFIKAGATLATNLGITLGSYVYAPYYSNAYPRTFTNGFKSYIQYNSAAPDLGATLVVLRDPMFAANPVTVQY